MSRSSVLVLTILSLFVMTSAAIIVNESSTVSGDGNGGVNGERQQWEGFLVNGGERAFDASWIAISSYDDLLTKVTDMNDNYYLTNDIDLTNVFYEDSFNIRIALDINGNNVTISLLLDTEPDAIQMYVSSMVIFVNGMSEEITTEGKATATFTLDSMPNEFTISAAGTATNLDNTYDGNFVISASGSKTVIEGAAYPSKGNFESIGSSSDPFKGTFDGNGYRIIGLRTFAHGISGSASSGLFAFTDGATIMNLGMEGGSSIAVSNGTSSLAETHAGSLIGYATSTVIINSYSTSVVEAAAFSGSASAAYAGGLVGQSKLAIEITDSYYAGHVNAAATISSTTFAVTAIANAGGLVGVGNSTVSIINSHNTGYVTVITSKSSTGTVISSNAGLIGNATSYITITNSYNAGDIKASTNSNASMLTGGLIGSADLSATITNSYNTGNITATASSSAYAGGLIGYAKSTTDITNSYNTGKITAMALSKAYAGGLIGYANSTTDITNSYNIGDITATTSELEAYSGGLIGYAKSTTDITNSYNKGNIATTATSSASAGGLIGFADSLNQVTITSSYFLGEDTEKLIGNGTTGATIDTHSGPRSEGRMKITDSRDPDTVRTYVDWNFTTLWKIGTINGGFPYLDPIGRWENFTINEGDSYDPTNEENDWIKISTAEDLQKMGSDPSNYPLDGKYYLTNNIDLTHIKNNTQIEIILTVERTDNNKIAISLNYLYQENIEALEFDSIVISVGEEIKTFNTGDPITFTIDPAADKILITAGGTLEASQYDITALKDFVISATIDIPAIYEKNSMALPSEGNFTPIGSSTPPFIGTLDGNGYTITGLRTTSYSTTTIVYSGLFAYTSGVTIRNLGLEGGSSTAIVSSPSSINASAGGLIGYATTSSATTTTITNSYNTGSITATASTPSTSSPLLYAYAGGLIGYAHSDGIEITIDITNSYNTGSINTTASSGFSANPYSGGLIGYAFASAPVTATTIITNSYNTGSIIAASLSNTSIVHAGGLIGHAYRAAEITNSYNTGEITAIAISYAYVGGLIGDVYASAEVTIYNSYNTGDITATVATWDSYAGGLIGYAHSATIAMTITNSYNTGNVIATVSSLTSAYTASYAGGLAGYTLRAIGITNSYNTGDITATTSSTYNTGGATTLAYASGLVGRASSTSTISNSYSTGSINATVSSSQPPPPPPPASPSSNAYAGGLIGYAQLAAEITNSYNIGNITVAASSTDTNTYASAGGLIGLASSTKTITNSYNIGDITAIASSSSLANAYLGGLIGYSGAAIFIKNSYNAGGTIATASSNAFAGGLIGYAEASLSGNITSSYALKDVGANYLIGNNSASIVIGNSGFRSKEDMMTLRGKDLPTFVGWDIWGIWALDQTPDLDNDDRINKGFPYLRKMPNDEGNKVTIKVTAGTGCSNIDIEFNGSVGRNEPSPFNGYKTDDMEITISAKESFIISGILINGELWDVSNTDVTAIGLGKGKCVISFLAEEDQYLIEVIFRSPMYSVKVEFDPDNIGSEAAPPAAGLRNISGDFNFNISIGQGYLFDKAEVKAGGDAVIDFTNGVLSVSSVGSSSVVLITAGVSKELTISVIGTGKVKIYVDDGSTPVEEVDESASFTGSYLSTTKIELVAENVGLQYSFSHWEIPTGGNIPSGFDNLVVDPDQFTMNNDYEFTAIFSDDLKTLTLAVSGSGYILLNVGGVDSVIETSLPAWNHSFDSGTDISVTAVERTGEFLDWTFGTAGAPQSFDPQESAQQTFDLDEEYELTANFTAGSVTTTYTITSTSDPRSTISPEGTIIVSQGGSQRFNFSAIEGYTISTVTVDGVRLSQEDMSRGYYIFFNVNMNHTIHVESVEEGIFLEITITEGYGHAEYRIGGTSYFSVYSTRVELEEGSNVTVRAYPNEGYEFVEWRYNSNIIKEQETSFNDTTSSIYLELVFKAGGPHPSPSIFDEFKEWIIALIVLILLALLLLWFLLFYRRSYEVVKIESDSKIIGKDRALRKREYKFSIEGPSALVTYSIGEEGEWKTLNPGPDGEYVIPKDDVVDKLNIRVR